MEQKTEQPGLGFRIEFNVGEKEKPLLVAQIQQRFPQIIFLKSTLYEGDFLVFTGETVKSGADLEVLIDTIALFVAVTLYRELTVDKHLLSI